MRHETRHRDNIHPAHFLDDAAKEIRIGPRSDSYLGAFPIELGASGIDINPEDNRLRL